MALLQGCTWVSGTELYHSDTHHEIFEATAELLVEFVLLKNDFKTPCVPCYTW